MASRKDIVAGGAAVEIRAIDQATNVLHSVTGNFVAAGQRIAAVGMKMVAAAAAASAAIVAMSVVAASWGASVDDAAKRTGVSAEALQELRYGAEQSGASFDDLVAGFRNMNKELAGDGAADKLAAIGLNIDDIRKLKPDEQFVAIADAISKIKDAATQTDAAMAIFGKGGFALLPMLQEGAGGIGEFRQEAQRLGLVLSGEVIEKFAVYDDTMARISASTKAVTALFAAAFLPVLQPIADVVTAATAAMASWLGENQQIGTMIAIAIAAVAGLGMAFITIGGILAGPISLLASFATIAGGFVAVFGTFAAPIAAIGAGVAAAFGIILATGTALAAMFAANWFAAQDFDEALSTLNGGLAAIWKSINQVYESLASQFGPAIEGVITAIRDADFYSAGKLAFMGLQLAASEIMQWVTGFFRARIAEIFGFIGEIVVAVTGDVDYVKKELDTITARTNEVTASYEKQQQKLREQIASVKEGVDAKHEQGQLDRHTADAQEQAALLDEQMAQMEAKDYATRMQKKMAEQQQTGYEPGGDATKTLGTAASGVASMVVAPMAGVMEPVVNKLDAQLTVQNKIEQNTKNGATFGA